MKNPKQTKHLNCSTLDAAITLMRKLNNEDEYKSGEWITPKIIIDRHFEELNLACLKNLDLAFKYKSALITMNGDGLNNSIYWKLHKIQKFAWLKVAKVKIITEFVADFLINSLKEGSTGIIDIEYEDKRLSLLSIGDSFNQNLLLVATKYGNEKCVDYLLKHGIRPELLESETTAQSLALQNGHYDILLQLLNWNLTYPKNIIIEDCPEKLKQFFEIGEIFHKMVMEGNKEKLNELIKQNPKLRYFYNISNKSALKFAADIGFLDMVEFLSFKNLLFAPHEDTNEIKRKLNFRNNKIIPDMHINILLANTLFLNDEANDEIRNRNLILQIYNKLNSDDRLKIILQVVAATKVFRIIFDFKYDDTIRNIESAVVPGALGTTFKTGIISIGARKLHNKEKENEILGVLIHELCHYAMLLIYENNFNPFKKRDEKAESKFTEIFESCRKDKEKDSVILSVYTDYQAKNQLSELIVRPPHLIAKYICNPKKLEITSSLFKKLFEHFANIVVPEMEKSIPMIEKKLTFNPENPIGSVETCEENNKETENSNIKENDELCELLEHKDVINRIIYVLICLQNADKKNKGSFNIILKHLYDNFQSIKVTGNRRLENDEDLLEKGFLKQSGTSNIKVWSDIFLYTEKYGILLVNIQENNSVNDPSILKFTKLFSSILISNSIKKDFKSQQNYSQQVFLKSINIESFDDDVECSKKYSSGNFGIKEEIAQKNKERFAKKFDYLVKKKYLFSNENKVNAVNGHELSKRFKINNGKNEMDIKLIFNEENFKPSNKSYMREKSMEEITEKYKEVVKTSSKKRQDENELKYKENPGCSYQDPKRVKAASEYQDESESESDNDIRCDRREIARCCTSTESNRSNISLKFLKNNNYFQNFENVSTKREIKATKSTHTEFEKTIYFFKLIFKNRPLKEYSYDIFDLPDDVFIEIFESFNNDEKLNLIFTSQRFGDLFKRSRAIMKRFTLYIDKYSYNKLSNHSELLSLPMINITFDLDGVSRIAEILAFFKNFEESVENLKIKNAKFINFKNFLETFCNLKSIRSIVLEKCTVDSIGKEVLPQLETLKSISFIKCNDNVFEAFGFQKSVSKFSIHNNDWTWSGFPHVTFNLMAKNTENLEEIELIGDGTGSFFDSDDFLFRVRKLVTTLITFHWYVGIKTERISFLMSQKGYLEDLTIHKLPFDFDGGRVLKFIIEQMDLKTFFYGKIPLILNGIKQEIKEFEANEIQIQSAIEMFRQFPSITSFRLVLSVTDISSNDIERIINVETNLFCRLKIFELEDNSKYRSIFGVFLGFMKNLRNLRKLSLKTQDRNINTLLGEFLPHMNQLKEIYLPSTVSRERERFEIIKINVPTLNKISVPVQHVSEAKSVFGSSVAVCEI